MPPMPGWRAISKGTCPRDHGSAWGGCGVDQCRVRRRSGECLSGSLPFRCWLTTSAACIAARRRAGRPSRGGAVHPPVPPGEPAGRTGGGPAAPGAGPHRALRDLLAHDQGAGPWRSRGLAQQQPLHRPAVLAQPAGARPPRGERRRRDRQRVRRPPARDHHRRADPPDADRVPPERSAPSRAQDLERAAHALRRLSGGERGGRRSPQPRLHRAGSPARLGRWWRTLRRAPAVRAGPRAGTEIGARNLGDTGRYDQHPVIAVRMSLDTSSERTLWRDLALVELNVAVLHSFERVGITITDHHTESHRFLAHLRREEQAGRLCPADWSWIVPPVSGSTTPVFHRYYDQADLRPNYVYHPEALALARGNLPGS